MGSLVVKLDKPTQDRLRNRHHYSDIDMIKFNGDSVSEIPMEYDVEAVKLSVRNILMWRVGENVIRPEFGHNIKLSMYAQNIDSNRQIIAEEIKRAIEDNEPRAKIVTIGLDVGDEDSSQAESLHVKVVYKVVSDIGQNAELTEDAVIQGK